MHCKLIYINIMESLKWCSWKHKFQPPITYGHQIQSVTGWLVVCLRYTTVMIKLMVGYWSIPYNSNKRLCVQRTNNKPVVQHLTTQQMNNISTTGYTQPSWRESKYLQEFHVALLESTLGFRSTRTAEVTVLPAWASLPFPKLVIDFH